MKRLWQCSRKRITGKCTACDFFRFSPRINGTVAGIIIGTVLGLLIGCFILSASASPQSQNPTLTYVKTYPDGTYQIKVNAEVFWAVGTERAKALRDAEQTAPILTTDLKLCQSDVAKEKQNVTDERQRVQDERLEKAKIHTMYDDQVKLSGECFALLKRGGGKVGRLLDNPFFRVGEDGIKTAIQMRRCH